MKKEKFKSQNSIRNDNIVIENRKKYLCKPGLSGKKTAVQIIKKIWNGGAFPEDMD